VTDHSADKRDTCRYTVVIWPVAGGYHAFIPAFEIALPETDSLEAMLEAARSFVVEQISLAEIGGDELPADVEIIVERVEAQADDQLRMPAELFSASLSAAVGEVIVGADGNREVVAVLLDVLTGIAGLLQSDAAASLASPAIWSEQELHAAVREALDARVNRSDLTSVERIDLRDQLRDALDRQFTIARDLDLA